MTTEEGLLTVVFDDQGATKRRLQKSKLVVIEGPDRGKELTVDHERVSVGRGAVCDFVLTDRAASGVHLEIVTGEKGFLLRDMDSTNGTYCGDLRIREVW